MVSIVLLAAGAAQSHHNLLQINDMLVQLFTQSTDGLNPY
jgi:hypothetical protein